MERVGKGQRFTRWHPCPVCGGYDDRRAAKRCWGFLSDDGKYAHCTEMDGAPYNEGSDAYVHRTTGNCQCGADHEVEPAAFAKPKARRKPEQDPTLAAMIDILGPVTHKWPYRTPDGTISYVIARHEQMGVKTYRPYRRAGSDWRLGMDAKQPILYRLSEVLSVPEGGTIYIAEGEKCVDALAELGLVATTNPGGALKWSNLDAAERHAAFDGRHVVILPDNDPEFDDRGKPHRKGQRHALEVANDLRGFAATLKIVSLPDLPVKGDVFDWLALGRTRDQLEALVAAADEWLPTVDEAPAGTDHLPERRLKLLSRADLQQVKPPNWLIRGYLLEQGLAFLVGPPGSYKSFLMLDWALCVATGLDWNENKTCKSGPVVYLCGEGLGGINKRVTAWERQHGVVADDFYTIGQAVALLDPASMDELRQVLRELPAPPAMVIIDTLSRAMTGGDPSSSKEIMIAIQAADMIQREFHCLVPIVHHTNKQGDVLGSISIEGAADTLMIVEADGDVVTLHCKKQKDFDEFADQQFLARRAIMDDNPDNDSRVLEPYYSEESDAALLKSQRDALEALAGFGTAGATKTEWEKAAIATARFSDRTFYKAAKALHERGYVAANSPKQGAKFTLTEAGQIAMETTASTEKPLNLQQMQERGLDRHTPPKGGVSSNPPRNPPASSRAGTGTEGTIVSLPVAKGLPPPDIMRTIPCDTCRRTDGWVRQPTEYGNGVVCAHDTCNPPRTWRRIS